MNIALCYESVLPARGGAETYLGDLSRRLVADGHEVHLYACRWDATALPAAMQIHAIPPTGGLRFLRVWQFGRSVLKASGQRHHDVTVGFDKTWGQDVLYPQGGFHAASQRHNRRKNRTVLGRWLAIGLKYFDSAYHSYRFLERTQYLVPSPPTVVVNSRLVLAHMKQYLRGFRGAVHVVHSAIDPSRFEAHDRESIRTAERANWHIAAERPVALFVGMNYRLKGLGPLIRAAALLPDEVPLVIAVVGHAKFNKYERLAERLNCVHRFRFLGHRSNPKSAYFASDFLIHPTFYDPCSLVALEALACGLPVITTQYNGAKEFIQDGFNGLVIDDPHDAIQLCKAMAHFCEPLKLHSSSVAARATAQNWTFDQHYKALLEILKQVANQKRLPPAGVEPLKDSPQI